jgi:hypothetical protein
LQLWIPFDTEGISIETSDDDQANGAGHGLERARPRFKASWNVAVAMAGEHVPITVESVKHALMLDDIDKLGMDKDYGALLWALCKGQKGVARPGWRTWPRRAGETPRP